MGCHTWFSVPVTDSKVNIIHLAQTFLDNAKYLSEGHKKMYQYAIDNQICEPVCELAMHQIEGHRYGEWVLYKSILDYTVEKYNIEHNTNYDKYDIFFRENDVLESYSDEPRIGGYPDKIIHSFDEMVEFMKTGFDNEDGEHYDFYYDETRIERVMYDIKQFFINHPDGIITFG